MISIITIPKALTKVSANLRQLRLEKGLTQAGLSGRSGVSLPTLRKFEQKGQISLESLFKIAMALGCLEKLVEATEPSNENYTSIDQVLDASKKNKRQRGWKS